MNEEYYNRQFHLYKFDRDNKQFKLISSVDQITEGRYIIATDVYALYVLDNSGVVVGTSSSEACVPAVQARNTPQGQQLDYTHTRNPSYYRNSDNEQATGATVGSGYRAFYSLQLCNNEHVVKANLPKIFGLQCHPEDIASGRIEDTFKTHEAPNIVKRTTTQDLFDRIPWNLAYDRAIDEAHTLSRQGPNTSTIYDVSVVRGGTEAKPVPAVNPPIHVDHTDGVRSLGDAISLGQHNIPGQTSPQGENRYYTLVTETGVEIQDTQNADNT